MKYEATITPDLRLRILKRDNFVCRNCGAQAPLAYLGAKSLIPGRPDENDPANLITLCAACMNADHGDRIYAPSISWDEKLAQLQQFVESKHEGKHFAKEQTRQIVQYIDSCLSPYHSLTPAETFSIEKIIHKSGCDKVFSILDDAFYDKIKYENDRMTLESKNEFMNAISSYSYVKSLSGVEQAIIFAVGYCRSKYGRCCGHSTKKGFREYVDDLRRAGYKDAQIEKDFKEEVSRHISSYDAIADFERWISRHKKELVQKEAALPPQRTY